MTAPTSGTMITPPDRFAYMEELLECGDLTRKLRDFDISLADRTRSLTPERSINQAEASLAACRLLSRCPTITCRRQ
jgi:hypothetical protein